MEPSERFEVLRQMLPQHLHDDVVVQRLADQSCEIEFARGALIVRDGQSVSETYVVIIGRVEVRQRSGRRWVAAVGAVIDAVEGVADDPAVVGAAGVSLITGCALESTAVLAVPMLRRPTRGNAAPSP